MTTSIGRLFIILVVTFFVTAMSYGQAVDSVYSQHTLEDHLETIFEDAESTSGWDDEIEELQQLSTDKIELNTATRQQLEQLPFLSDKQVENILKYIDFHHGIASLGELILIDGMDYETVQKLRPFVKTDASALNKPKTFPSFSKIARYGHHELMGRYDQPFYERKGYTNGKYLGRSFYHSARYKFNYGDYIQLGFTAEKDAGEPFFALHNKKGYDHYSPFLLIQNYNRWLRSLAIGNYRLNFGQGLVLGNGFMLGKSYSLETMEMRPSGIRKHSSTDEYNYFSGIATAVNFGKEFTLSAFYSYRKMEGTQKGDSITSIYKTGLHRTEAEAGKRDAFSMQLYGGNLTYRRERIQLGLTGIRYTFSKPYEPTLKGYSRYNLHGDDFFNASVDYRIRIRNFTFQGEEAIGRSGYALLNQVHYRLSSRYHFMLLHRLYSHKYWAFFAKSFSEGSAVQDENGWYVAAELNPLARWKFFFSADFLSFPWWRYRISRPSQAMDYMAQATYRVNPSWELKLNYRYKQKDRDVTGTSGEEIFPTYYHRTRLQLNGVVGIIALRTTADYNNFRQQGYESSQGYRFSQQMTLTPRHFPLNFTIQGTYFHTDDYDSRVYVYERSLLNTFSSASYQGKGFRYSVFVRSDINRHVMLIARLGHTIYSDRDEISSGNDLIPSNQKLDLQLQLRLKF